MDFTLKTYTELLKALKERDYLFQTYKDFILNPTERVVIMRHDVDLLPGNSLATAQIESSLGIHGTYYFRIVPESFDTDIIKKIANLGHEIGYHYEDVDLVVKQNSDMKSKNVEIDKIKDLAYKSFCNNLEKVQRVSNVSTVCMHGSPRSEYDNKIIWQKYDYKKLGIIGEPYFDLDFNQFGYLTDTGRRWNGSKVSVRDKVDSKFNFDFRKTSDIINDIEKLPDKIMFTIHPQRWHRRYLPWFKEIIFQNIKNTIKKYYFVDKK